MNRQLLVATRNSDKLREIRDKLKDLPFDVLGLADFPLIDEVEEDQPDLMGNAIKKARAAADTTGMMTMADDTGLAVEALGGAPGVLSARYSGPGATYDSNCEKLLREMREIPAGNRQAHFRTVMCLCTPDGLYCVEGQLSGTIGYEKRGQQGFGYDPVFVLEDGRTLAELDLVEKNSRSHRGQALDKMTKLLRFLTRDA